MKKFLPRFRAVLVLLFSFCALSLSAQCTIPYTQPVATDVLTGASIGQSWLGDCTGYLQSITVTSGNSAATATGVTLKIYQLDPVNLVLNQIYSRTGLTVPGFGVTTTFLTPNIPVVPFATDSRLGVYYFIFSVPSPNTLTLKGGTTVLSPYLFGGAVTSNLSVLSNPLNPADLVKVFQTDLSFTIVGSPTTLAAELTTFTAVKKDKQTQLDWMTSSETNHQYFAIERSQDGKNFKEMGQLAAKGSSTQQQAYQFIDPFPANGNNYYRLKQVAMDGNFKYSNIEVVTFKGAPDFVFYPNPAKDNIRIESVTTGLNHITIIDYMGRIWLSKTGEAPINDINIAELPTGLYFVECRLDNQLVRKKLIKQ